MGIAYLSLVTLGQGERLAGSSVFLIFTEDLGKLSQCLVKSHYVVVTFGLGRDYKSCKFLNFAFVEFV